MFKGHSTSCRLLKDFERQARSDGMPSELLTQRKKPLAHELNQLIDMKKRSRAFAERSELLEGAAGPPKEENLESRCAATGGPSPPAPFLLHWLTLDHPALSTFPALTHKHGV
jgi:hypothetical protein